MNSVQAAPAAQRGANPPAVGRTLAVTLEGLSATIVAVEVIAIANLPNFIITGLPDTALAESRDRIRAAFASTGFAWPNKRVTVNLSPAAVHKSGSAFDIGIAVAVLAAAGFIPPEAIEGTMHLGELGLDGAARPMRGTLPAVVAARTAGIRRVVVPAGNLLEAKLIDGPQIVGVESLAELAESYGATVPWRHTASASKQVHGTHVPGIPDSAGGAARPMPDMADVIGQDIAKQALEIAAAGGHHMLMCGPPGTGKTMLASRLPGILPPLERDAAIEVTAVHSIAGLFQPQGGLITRPPFEAPHHTATPAAIVGGGSGIPRPGAASRAHRGVLFLDEAPEFSARVLETLRQPLESGQIVLARALGQATYPARFQLVLAANPCPCGLAIGKGIECRCSSVARRRYLERLSAPFRDRIDLQVEVESVPDGALEATSRETSASVARRVAQARAAQLERLAGYGWSTNREADGAWLRGKLGESSGAVRAAREARRVGLASMRGMDSVLRVAWTIADLEGRPAPGASDVDAALTLRSGLDR
ncbi:MAG: YifB family Mg chelatase-like AAA ATPase [Bifidobacteriaceae bacterium]|jgi:magnesium chelatase family protein|nr:YifB family Mg chelatase-like AAA ATPase [Bifidobacteriaceae bacterium]